MTRNISQDLATSTYLLDRRSPGRRDDGVEAHAKPIKQAKRRQRSLPQLTELPEPIAPAIVPSVAIAEPVAIPALAPVSFPVPAPDLSMPPLALPPINLQTAPLSGPSAPAVFFPCLCGFYWGGWPVVVGPQEGGNPPVPTVPEPGEWALLSSGLFAIGGLMRLLRKRANRQPLPNRI